MTERDLATLLREHLADEPPLGHTVSDAIHTARRQTVRRRGIAAVAGVLAVTAVAALGLGIGRSPSERSGPVAVAPDRSLTEEMEAVATDGFGSHVGALGEPRWRVATVVGDPVEADDPTAQSFLLDYRPERTPQVNLTVSGFAASDREHYDFTPCEQQLARGALASCRTTTLADGSLMTVSVGPISGMANASPTSLTMAQVDGRDPATFAWARVVGIDSADNVGVRASEYVRSDDLADADWQVPVATLRAMATDPLLLGAEVAHEPMPGVTGG